MEQAIKKTWQFGKTFREFVEIQNKSMCCFFRVASLEAHKDSSPKLKAN
jgi:hypothetical protein